MILELLWHRTPWVSARVFVTAGPQPWHTWGWQEGPQPWHCGGLAGRSPALPHKGWPGVGVPGWPGWGFITPLAAWAAPACAGSVRGEGQTEEFAIWASLLLSCCYGTAEMLLGRRWWPACVTPGLPGGREMSLVYEALLFSQLCQGRVGALLVKYTQWVSSQDVSVKLLAAFNKVR